MSMKTRRKSKAAAAAATAEPDSVSVAPVEGATGSSSRAEFSVQLPDDVDLETLSRFLPDVPFETPTPDAVLSLYRLVLSQAADLDGAVRDLEDSRAENERKDVELDQALQDRESSVSSIEAQIKTLQEELGKLKQERNTLGEFRTHSCAIGYLSIRLRLSHSSVSSNSNLESQISILSSSSTELDSFKHRIDDTEREKRDLLGVISRLKEDNVQRDGEFSIFLPITCTCQTQFNRGSPDPSCESQTGETGPTITGTSG